MKIPEKLLKKVLHQISEINYSKLHFVLGIVKDKKIYNILTLLPKDILFIIFELIDKHSKINK